MYLATRQKGVFRSTNDGKQWELLSNEKTPINEGEYHEVLSFTHGSDRSAQLWKRQNLAMEGRHHVRPFLKSQFRQSRRPTTEAYLHRKLLVYGIRPVILPLRASNHHHQHYLL